MIHSCLMIRAAVAVSVLVVMALPVACGRAERPSPSGGAEATSSALGASAEAPAGPLEEFKLRPPSAGPLAGRRVCIDPGHDAYWAVGATARSRTGRTLLHPIDQIPLYEHEL